MKETAQTAGNVGEGKYFKAPVFAVAHFAKAGQGFR